MLLPFDNNEYLRIRYKFNVVILVTGAGVWSMATRSSSGASAVQLLNKFSNDVLMHSVSQSEKKFGCY